MKRAEIENKIYNILEDNQCEDGFVLQYQASVRLTDLFIKLSEEREIELLESVNEDVKDLHPEYITEYIKNRISILKHGI